MKSAHVVRRLDQLGRIVLPKQLRREYEMNEGEPIEIFVEGEYILLEKYRPKCIFCGNNEDVGEFHEKNICITCMNELAAVGK